MKDNETLLNDFDPLAMADYGAFMLDDDLAGFVVVEVTGSIEVVEAVHGRETSPVVERAATASGCSSCQPQNEMGYEKATYLLPCSWARALLLRR